MYEKTVERVTARYAARIFDYAPGGPNTDVLDAASGAGAVALEAARRGANALATDFSPRMVDRLRERVASAVLTNVRVAIMDCQALDLADASQDLVTCNFELPPVPTTIPFTIAEPWVFATPESLVGFVRTNPGCAGMRAQVSAGSVTAVIAAAVNSLRSATESLTMEAHLAIAKKG